MAEGFLEVERVGLGYARSGFRLEDASFRAARGEIVALLGPSGCGKTTLLNAIAGFITPDTGHIRVAGRDLISVPPHRRDMAMVFQNYALFPHMSVEKNVAFGLEARGTADDECRRRVGEALEMVGLAESRGRYPKQLSGGQQQRVALARALVIRPSVLLLDEPLSNLDTLLRKTMREEIQQILRRTQITAVLVTHDQEEALVVADRILLMSDGRIDQVGTPEEIYEAPRTVFCARFMAFDNLFEGSVSAVAGEHATVVTAAGLVRGRRGSVTAGAKATVAVRAERIRVLDAAGAVLPGENSVAGEVVRSTYHGTYQRLEVAAGSASLVVHAPVGGGARGRVHLAWSATDTHVLPPT
jgi:putative spermidine/putrescine transport system ATP-binding protein